MTINTLPLVYDCGERVRLEAETAGIRKKVGLILARKDCQRVSGKAKQHQQRAWDNKTQQKLPSALRRHTATCASNGNRVSD